MEKVFSILKAIYKVVAGLSIGNIIAWITPSILGTIYIIYWNRKLKSKTVKTIKIQV